MDDRGFSHNCTWVGNPALPVDTTTYPTSSNFHSTTSYSSTSLSFAGLDLLFELKPLFVPLYSMVILVACSGNLFLLVLIGLNRKRHNTTNFLIGNLALVDLVMCIICVPLTASYAFDRRGWLYGHFMCHFATLMQSAAVFAAVLSLAAIAVDRYVVVAYPIRRRLGCKFCWSLVAVIWLFSLALSTPTALHTSYLDLSATGIHMSVCEEFWHGEEIGRIVYSGFVVNLIRDLDTDFTILEKNHVNVIQVSCHLFAMSSTCYNPFIYASLHDKFLSFLCQRFFFPRHRWEGGKGPGTSLSTSHHLTRVYKLR
ncbi:hypothetical protein DPEC_G00318020 [Dallia pectoralis]|uniref:Uncharacterized protein n=1 Tax=Dallia pectoralis TaxID=75939 RepID=A0ACC2FDC5_DALPE|nr:hypothetical protein DPEC_G00318020 [Dallia pectoralis]